MLATSLITAAASGISCIAMAASADAASNAPAALAATMADQATATTEAVADTPRVEFSSDVEDTIAALKAKNAAEAEIAAGVDAETGASDDQMIDDYIEDPAADAPIATPSVEERVFADDSDEELAQRLFAYLDDLTTVEADFVQSSPSGQVTEGKFWLRRPRQLRMEYAPLDDSPLVIVASQGNVYVQDKALETTDLYPVKRTPLRFLLNKSVEEQDLDIVALERGPSSVAMTVRDPDSEAEGDLTLVFDAPTLSLRQWLVRDPRRGLTIVSLENIERDGKLRNSLFRTPEAGGAFINN